MINLKWSSLLLKMHHTMSREPNSKYLLSDYLQGLSQENKNNFLHLSRAWPVITLPHLECEGKLFKVQIPRAHPEIKFHYILVRAWEFVFVSKSWMMPEDHLETQCYTSQSKPSCTSCNWEHTSGVRVLRLLKTETNSVSSVSKTVIMVHAGSESDKMHLSGIHYALNFMPSKGTTDLN